MNCELCGKDITNKKKDNHHIDYEKNVTILICFGCHQWLHGRSVFYNVWTSKFGKDRGFYEFAKAFINLYNIKMNEVKV